MNQYYGDQFHDPDGEDIVEDIISGVEGGNIESNTNNDDYDDMIDEDEIEEDEEHKHDKINTSQLGAHPPTTLSPSQLSMTIMALEIMNRYYGDQFDGADGVDNVEGILCGVEDDSSNIENNNNMNDGEVEDEDDDDLIDEDEMEEDEYDDRNMSQLGAHPPMTLSSSHPGSPPPIPVFTGAIPLGLIDDKYRLSNFQCYILSHFAEAFSATEKDVAAPRRGHTKPILGQVGIRCMYCKNDPIAERGQMAVSYPSLITGIHKSVKGMLSLHFDCCLTMPTDVRRKIEQLNMGSHGRKGAKQYWIDSAKRLGLIDTPLGMRFSRDPYSPLPPTSNFTEDKVSPSKVSPSKVSPSKVSPSKKATKLLLPPPPPPTQPSYPLVDYIYLTFAQMQPCTYMDYDCVGRYKGRDMGFPGLTCKHCMGQAGSRRYFPVSEASLSQTTTTQTILKHVQNCRHCPIEIRESLELMKRAKLGPDGEKAHKRNYGGRKIFFHRLWCRIQGLEIQEEEDVGEGVITGQKKKEKNKKKGKQQQKKTNQISRKRRLTTKWKKNNILYCDSDKDENDSIEESLSHHYEDSTMRSNDNDLASPKEDSDTESDDDHDDPVRGSDTESTVFSSSDD